MADDEVVFVTSGNEAALDRNIRAPAASAHGAPSCPAGHRLPAIAVSFHAQGEPAIFRFVCLWAPKRRAKCITN